jgi:hypothetical protein
MANTAARTGATRQALNPAWFERAVEAAGHATFITDPDGGSPT